jgi:DNA-binding GntR family transcriptional regulator
MAKQQLTLDNLLPAPEKARLGILEMIRSGQIPSGQRIDQRSISKELNLTTAPIREALSSLETDGFLQRIPGVGIFCKAYTVDEIEEIIQIRDALEGLAARRAAERISEVQKAELLEMAEKLSHEGIYATDRDFLEAHIAFHSFIAEISQSERLIQMLKCNHIIQQVLWNISANIWPVAPHDHTEIAKAICSGDPQLAEQTTRNHIAPTFKERIKQLKLKYGTKPIIAQN